MDENQINLIIEAALDGVQRLLDSDLGKHIAGRHGVRATGTGSLSRMR